MFLKAGEYGISTSTSVSHWNLLLLPLSYGSDIDSKFEWDTDVEVEFPAAPALLSMDARVPLSQPEITQWAFLTCVYYSLSQEARQLNWGISQTSSPSGSFIFN
uniref:Uncharacterized protein n=1 Tax=Oryza sativa subsp. japonica TaxID=39947 RepID=Q8LGW2_ORYSJ|nr:hypothetical protein [Oryza sativa Japonica Group]